MPQVQDDHHDSQEGGRGGHPCAGAFRGGRRWRRRPARSQDYKRKDTKFQPLVFTGVIGFVLVALLIALVLRSTASVEPWLKAPAAIVLGPPLAWAGYTFLRDAELEGYQGTPLIIRSLACGLVYALLWGVFVFLGRRFFGDAFTRPGNLADGRAARAGLRRRHAGRVRVVRSRSGQRVFSLRDVLRRDGAAALVAGCRRFRVWAGRETPEWHAMRIAKSMRRFTFEPFAMCNCNLKSSIVTTHPRHPRSRPLARCAAGWCGFRRASMCRSPTRAAADRHGRVSPAGANQPAGTGEPGVPGRQSFAARTFARRVPGGDRIPRSTGGRRAIRRRRLAAKDAEVFLAAALLHDVGHWPFGHPIEDLRLPQHRRTRIARVGDASIAGEVADVLRDDWQIDPNDVADLVAGERHNPAQRILRSMLSGPIDVDKIDYLMRDSLHAGVPYGRNFDRRRLISSLCLNEAGDALAITDKGKTAAEMMVFARYVMFSEVYWHHAVRVGDRDVSAGVLHAARRAGPRTALLAMTERPMIDALAAAAGGRTAACELLDGIFGAAAAALQAAGAVQLFRRAGDVSAGWRGGRIAELVQVAEADRGESGRAWPASRAA